MRSRLLTSALALTLLAASTACVNEDIAAAPATDAAGNAIVSFDPMTVQEDPELAAQVPAKLKSKGTLVIGSDTSYPPAEFLKSDNQTAQGYDIDLAKAIGQTLGLNVQVQTAEFGSILPGIGTQYDLGISSFTVNPERIQAVNMVTYLQVGTQWVVQTGNPRDVDLEDVCGRSIGVQTATVQEEPDLQDRNAQCLADGKEAIDIVSLKNQTDVTTRLVGGGLDAMASDSSVATYAIAQTNGQLEALGDTYDAAPQAIAVAKADPELAQLIQKTVQKLMDDGTYEKVLASWANTESAITTSELNPDVS